MSGTDKDKPFWVRLNQEAKYTDHDHRYIGKSYMRRRYLSDESGDPIYEEVQHTRTATEIVRQNQEMLWWGDSEVVAKAKLLHSAGRGHEEVVIRSFRVRKYELVEEYYPDHCTEGEPLTREESAWRKPCHPTLGHEGYYWRFGPSRARQSLLKMLHGKDRTHTNNTLRNMTKAANYRDEGWEDEFESDLLESTQPYKNGMAWLLW